MAHQLILTKSQLPLLLEKLTPLLPAACSVVGAVRFAIQHGNIVTVVDRWPDVSVVVCAAIGDQMPLLLKGEISCYTTDVKKLETFISQCVAIDWAKPFSLYGVLSTHMTAFERVAQKHGGRILSGFQDSHTLSIRRCEFERKPVPTLPAGYSFSTLGLEDAKIVVANWEHILRIHSSEKMMEFVRFLIEHFPSYGIRDEDGELVCQGLTTFGRMGALVTDPKHRRKGLALYVLYQFHDEAFRKHSDDEFGVLHVAVDNDITLSLSQKFGFSYDSSLVSKYGIYTGHNPDCVL